MDIKTRKRIVTFVWIIGCIIVAAIGAMILEALIPKYPFDELDVKDVSEMTVLSGEAIALGAEDMEKTVKALTEIKVYNRVSDLGDIRSERYTLRFTYGGEEYTVVMAVDRIEIDGRYYRGDRDTLEAVRSICDGIIYRNDIQD